MTLPTSGAFTLDAIHVEAGGSTGTTCSFNDTDIRGLIAASGKTINSTQGTTIDFDDFNGAVHVELTSGGTCVTKQQTIQVGKESQTITHKGISTTDSSNAQAGSWSDQDYATSTRGAFKIYDLISAGGTTLIVDSAAGIGISWSAFCGFRYIKDSSGNIYFDSNQLNSSGAASVGTSSGFGTQGGGASSGSTGGTRWQISTGTNSVIQMPSSGTISLILSNQYE